MKKFTKPKRFDSNVVVIGAGSAGLVSSLIVTSAKGKVVLIEKDKMGGDCLHRGCIPSKSLIRSSRVMSYIKRANEFGIDTTPGEINFVKIMDRVKAIIKTIEPHDSIERFTSLGVECVKGEAKIESPFLVSVNGRKISTRSIIIATGASPRVPDIPGIENINYLTSDSIWGLQELPKRLLVVGAGPIGCELAQAFSKLGSKVTQIDMAPRIMPREDPEVSTLVADQFFADGVNILTEHEVSCFGQDDEQSYAEVLHKGRTIRVEFDEVLVAVGRIANTTGLGLENLNVPLTTQGNIAVNPAMQTGHPNIFACGDVAGPYQFTHMASYQAFFASVNAIFSGIWRINTKRNIVPWATFISPEVARVGLNEEEAKARGVAHEITLYNMDKLDRAIADGDPLGFIKILTVPRKDKILGVTIVGRHAGELIGEFVFAITHGMGLKKISAVTHVYPTLSEANKFAANAWRTAHLPDRYLPFLERFFQWRRGK